MAPGGVAPPPSMVPVDPQRQHKVLQELLQQYPDKPLEELAMMATERLEGKDPWDGPAVMLSREFMDFTITDKIQDRLDFLGLNYYGKEIKKGRSPAEFFPTLGFKDSAVWPPKPDNPKDQGICVFTHNGLTCTRPNCKRNHMIAAAGSKLGKHVPEYKSAAQRNLSQGKNDKGSRKDKHEKLEHVINTLCKVCAEMELKLDHDTFKNPSKQNHAVRQAVGYIKEANKKCGPKWDEEELADQVYDQVGVE